jgi:hypothetical protein
MTLDDNVHAFRLRLMARAQALGNVSQACREFGISRSLFCRWRKRYLTYGPDGLHPRRTGARPSRPPTLSGQTERAILALAITWPTWGPLQLALQLRQPEHGRWQMAPSTVYRLLRRSGIQTRWERRAPHIQATKLGELVRLDTFYIGEPKGLGRVWQYTTCDAAWSFAVAQVSLEFSAEVVAGAEEDVLAYMAFPAEHWTRIYSTNPLERLNEEVKRRTNVVGVFGDEASVLRLVGSVLIEVWDDWQVGHRYFSQESMRRLSEPEALLVVEPQPLTLAPVK